MKLPPVSWQTHTGLSCQLLPLAAGDWPLFKNLYCDEEVMVHLGSAMSEQAARALFDRILNEQQRQPPECLLFKITTDQGEEVGLMGGFFQPGDQHCIYLGSVLKTEFQQCGVSTHAILAYGALVKKHFGVRFIETSSEVNNTGATRLMEKLGYQLVGNRVNSRAAKENCWRKEL